MKDALVYIVSTIVTDPKKVSILETEEDGIISFTVKVPQDEMGKLIGKNGKVIRSIRNVMKIPAIKQNKRITISLEENQ